MSARHHASLAAFTLWTALAQAAEPSATNRPSIRTMNTPAGPVYELAFPSSPVRTASAPETDVQSTPVGPMLVLRRNSSTSVSGLRVGLVPTFPANVQAQALPNGTQLLVLPTREMPAAASAAPSAVVEIDPAKPGTRLEDTPRNDVRYRLKTPAPAASR
jgi:hypothetical protein